MVPQVAKAPTRAAAAVVVVAGAWNHPMPRARVECRMHPICAALAIWGAQCLADMFAERQVSRRTLFADFVVLMEIFASS